VIERNDAEFLLSRPEFLRFLYGIIQSAGIISNNVAADGRTVRDLDLSWFEGRRSLGHEILLAIEQGQPDALRSPDYAPVATLEAVIREAMNPKEKANGRRTIDDDDTRYGDLDE